jgi:hypothetical protein
MAPTRLPWTLPSFLRASSPTSLPPTDPAVTQQRKILDATRQLAILEGRHVARLSLNKIVIALDNDEHPESIVMDRLHEERKNEAASDS